MSPVTTVDHKPTIRMITASFIAGVGAMVMLGFVAPTMIRSGLSLTVANASAMEASAPTIAPLDVAAIEAQLDAADRTMQTARVRTDGAINRLESLSGR